jgi:hypothetical protein
MVQSGERKGKGLLGPTLQQEVGPGVVESITNT